MAERKIVIAGTGSGVGKTTITLGLLSALTKMGLTAQGFKCGPDFVDPSYHSAITKRPSRNLDSWILTKEQLLDVFSNGRKGADISVIEGVMGLYDGKEATTNSGSTAEISMILKCPVALVVNCENLARSAAAIVKGYQQLDNNVNIVAVIANKIGSAHHYQLVKAAIEKECQIPVIGYLPKEKKIELSERRLGLAPATEQHELNTFFETIGERLLATLDMKKLLQLAETAPIPTRARCFNSKRKNCNNCSGKGSSLSSLLPGKFRVA